VWFGRPSDPLVRAVGDPASSASHWTLAARKSLCYFAVAVLTLFTLTELEVAWKRFASWALTGAVDDTESAGLSEPVGVSQ
jgi:hypothetical protein